MANFRAALDSQPRNPLLLEKIGEVETALGGRGLSVPFRAGIGAWARSPERIGAKLKPLDTARR